MTVPSHAGPSFGCSADAKVQVTRRSPAGPTNQFSKTLLPRRAPAQGMSGLALHSESRGQRKLVVPKIR